MLKNYFKILIRNFARNKAFTLINVAGLTLGITCSLIMFLIVIEELSFNKYHEKADRLYHIGNIDIIDGREYTTPGVPIPMAFAVKEEIVGVEKATLVSHTMYSLISVEQNGDTKYYEESPDVVYVEPDFFEMFTWPVLEGSLEAMGEPNVVALSKELADKYFPEGNAVGQTIRQNKERDLKVIAVVEDRRDDSDFPFGIFISMKTEWEDPANSDSWGSTSSNNQMFVLLEPNTTVEEIEAQFPEFETRHWSEEAEPYMIYLLNSINEYHFDDRFTPFSQRSASKQMLMTYSAIGIFLIVTACFNFINMSTAMAVKRAKEVGMRKVLGSSRKQLMIRFLGETSVITFVSILLSVALTERLIPLAINDFFELSINFSLIDKPIILAFLLLIFVVVSLLAGTYPAVVLSRAKPINALKGSLTKKGNSGYLRKTLVVVQFVLCQLLIFGTIVAVQQMNYFTSVDMGFDKDFIATFRMSETDVTTQKQWETRLGELPGVIDFSIGSTPPFSGSIMGTNVFYDIDDTTRTELNIQFKRADEKYLETYGLRLLAGEWLPKNDTIAYTVVNESFVKKMGLEEPIDAVNETIILWGRRLPIVGVVKDFHAITLSSAIEPMLFVSERTQYNEIGLRLNAASAEETMAQVEEIWYDIHEEYEFDYNYVDANIEEFYEQEKRMSQMLQVFAGISIFIGCLGLYGLIAFIANQKSKEIGIRKVLGARVSSIVSSFSLEFLKLVGIAFLVAAPIGFYGMNTWLSEYEYSITIGPIVFIASLLASILIAILTTGYRSLTAARANPVKSLRTE